MLHDNVLYQSAAPLVPGSQLSMIMTSKCCCCPSCFCFAGCVWILMTPCIISTELASRAHQKLWTNPRCVHVDDVLPVWVWVHRCQQLYHMKAVTVHTQASIQLLLIILICKSRDISRFWWICRSMGCSVVCGLQQYDKVILVMISLAGHTMEAYERDYFHWGKAWGSTWVE